MGIRVRFVLSVLTLPYWPDSHLGRISPGPAPRFTRGAWRKGGVMGRQHTGWNRAELIAKAAYSIAKVIEELSRIHW
jgi:hypothetical protein